MKTLFSAPSVVRQVSPRPEPVEGRASAVRCTEAFSPIAFSKAYPRCLTKVAVLSIIPKGSLPGVDGEEGRYKIDLDVLRRQVTDQNLALRPHAMQHAVKEGSPKTT